jgi:hypothetical protein
MTALSRILQPLRSLVAAFFRHDLAVRRDGDVVRLVLEERPRERNEPQVPKVSRVALTERKEREELAQIRAELAALLNELPETRQTMRHLVFVEQALGKKGLRALHKLPLDVLQRALEQLEGLVVNWSPVGLANLRSKMAVAVLDRENAPVQEEADAFRTAAVLDSTPVRPKPELLPSRSEDEALAAAYAALGDMAPAPVQFHGELGSASARGLTPAAVPQGERLPEIKLRELQE